MYDAAAILADATGLPRAEVAERLVRGYDADPVAAQASNLAIVQAEHVAEDAAYFARRRRIKYIDPELLAWAEERWPTPEDAEDAYDYLIA